MWKTNKTEERRKKNITHTTNCGREELTNFREKLKRYGDLESRNIKWTPKLYWVFSFCIFLSSLYAFLQNRRREEKNIKKNYAVFHSHKWTESASYAFIWFVVVVDFFCSYSFPFVSEQDRCERISCKPWTMKWMKFIVKSQVTNENIGAFQLASIVSLFMRSQCVVSLSFSLSLPLTLSLSLDLSLFSFFVAFLFFKKRHLFHQLYFHSNFMHF